MGLVVGFGFLAALAASPPPEKPFSFESLVSLIETRDVRSIDELLPLLPEKLRSNYTLMAQSRSLQPASPERPRVILFGEDARLLVAYAGMPDEPELEVIQYRPEEKAFDFRVISFAADGQKPIVSPRNPQKCLSCHRADPRPNWEPYARWPGAVAGNDDEMSDVDRAIVKALVKSQPMLPRYRPLLGLEAGYQEPASAQGRTAAQHNIQMTGRLARWNFQRMARLAKATPDYAKYRIALAAGTMAYDRASFLPPEVAARHVVEPPFFDEDADGTVASIDYFFEGRGIDTGDWSMAFDRRVARRFQTPGMNDLEWTYVLLEDNPDLWPYFTFEAPLGNGYSFERAVLKREQEGALRALSLQGFLR